MKPRETAHEKTKRSLMRRKYKTQLNGIRTTQIKYSLKCNIFHYLLNIKNINYLNKINVDYQNKKQLLRTFILNRVEVKVVTKREVLNECTEEILS